LGDLQVTVVSDSAVLMVTLGITVSSFFVKVYVADAVVPLAPVHVYFSIVSFVEVHATDQVATGSSVISTSEGEVQVHPVMGFPFTLTEPQLMVLSPIFSVAE
jgi:hypothetical protein